MAKADNTGRGAWQDGPGHEVARRARSDLEDVLLGIREIPLDLDRADLRDRLLRGIQYLYAALDTPVTALAHLTGLDEAAAVAAECRAILACASDAEVPALARIAAAEKALRRAAEEVARIQLDRRSELIGGAPEGPIVPARPLRASVGVPELHAPARRSLLPHIVVDAEVPLPIAPSPSAPVLPQPTTIRELRALAAAVVSGELQRRLMGDERGEEPPPSTSRPPPFAFEPAASEVEILRRLARDCIEEIANHRSLRKPNAIESWLDQAPFEQRLLDNLDAFAALGGPALPIVSLYHAEAKAPDPERAFAVAFTLGCIEGSDTVGAAVMTLKQSPPEELPGWTEGFWLAPSPAIDAVMADLCESSRPELVALALDVLHARGQTSNEVVASLLERTEPKIAWRVARACASTLPRREAIDHLERICATTDDDDLFLAAMESLLRRGDGPAVQRLRGAIDAPTSLGRAQSALPLLCLVGRASDLERLLGAANAAPTARLVRGLGRFGHVESMRTLLGLLSHQDGDIVAAAAEALERITGAGLRETVEEPWEIEFPPEAAEAGNIPVPTRKVERIVIDPGHWSTWIQRHAQRFDPKLKLRGGIPFVLRQIIDEMEAINTPFERRGEAALECALVTGISSPFSPQDWVARQKKNLAELRASVSAIALKAGAWMFNAAGHLRVEDDALTYRPTEKRSIAHAMRVEVTSEALSSPSHSPNGPPPPAWVPSPPAGGRVDQTRMPPAFTERAKAFLPFSGQASTLLRSLPVAVPSDHPEDATLPPPGLVADHEPAKSPLPFKAAAPVPVGTGIATVPDAYPVDATLPVTGLVANAILPFQPSRAALPAPRVAPRNDGALPFRSPVVFASPLPSEPPSSPISRPASSPNSHVTLEQYAFLCAELAVFPQQVETIFQRYGLISLSERLILDLAWQERLRRNPTEYREWQELYRRYHDHCLDQARRGRAR